MSDDGKHRVRSGAVRRGDVVIPYEVAGPDGGPVLLFGHGLTAAGLGSTAAFAPMVRAGWQVVVMDQRGHGASGPVHDAASLRPEDFGADLVAIVADLGADRVWFGGGSMGAATAMAAAAMAPERTLGVLAVIPAFGRARHRGLDVFATISAAYARSREAGERAWREAIGAIGASDAEIDQQIAAHRQVPAHTLALTLSVIPDWRLGAQIDAIAASQLPVGVIAWEGDDIHPMAVAEEIIAACPMARLRRWEAGEDGGDPEHLARVVLDLIESF